jgi:hypothetical protein
MLLDALLVQLVLLCEPFLKSMMNLTNSNSSRSCRVMLDSLVLVLVGRAHCSLVEEFKRIYRDG